MRLFVRSRATVHINYYTKNIADVQQSNPKQWWSAVKKIAGLSIPKMTKSLTFNDCTYQGEDLANLFNDKFVAVGSTLLPLNWCPLPVDVYPPKFIVSVEGTEAALLSSKLHFAVGPDEIPAWFLRENPSCCFVSSIMLHFQFVPLSRLRPFLVEVSQRFTNSKIFSRPRHRLRLSSYFTYSYSQ